MVDVLADLLNGCCGPFKACPSETFFGGPALASAADAAPPAPPAPPENSDVSLCAETHSIKTALAPSRDTLAAFRRFWGRSSTKKQRTRGSSGLPSPPPSGGKKATLKVTVTGACGSSSMSRPSYTENAPSPATLAPNTPASDCCGARHGTAKKKQEQESVTFACTTQVAVSRALKHELQHCRIFRMSTSASPERNRYFIFRIRNCTLHSAGDV